MKALTHARDARRLATCDDLLHTTCQDAHDEAGALPAKLGVNAQGPASRA